MPILLPYPVIKLKKGKERSLLQKHPWVFSGAIQSEPVTLRNGDLVQVHSHEGLYLATGHFQRGTISVRCFDFTAAPIDEDFIAAKIKGALLLRKTLKLPCPSTNCYRLIHGEGDGMPGLIADVYGNTLVIQTFTLGMHLLKPVLSQVIQQEMPDIDAIYDKSAETMNKHGITIDKDDFLFRKGNYLPDEFVVENGIKFSIDFINGQKTGFFLDQRFNRDLLRSYAAGKKILNTFSYSGGFSLSALKGEASEVHSVDSSAKAMDGLEKNLLLNSFGQIHHSYTEDVMHFFKMNNEEYDIIILDPPAYAKHLNQTANAMIGYRNLNTTGMKHVKTGGLLFTFSCSQAVDKELFRKIIFQSALQAKKEVKILHQLSQPADHPVSIYHPEAEYLKGFVLMIL